MSPHRTRALVASLCIVAVRPTAIAAQSQSFWRVSREFEEDTAAVRLRAAVIIGSKIVALTDGRAPVTTYDGAGKLVSRRGLRGQGPGEFRWPIAVSTEASGQVILVWDSGKSRMMRVALGKTDEVEMPGLPRPRPVSAEFEARWYGAPNPAFFVGSRIVIVQAIGVVSAPGDLSAYNVFQVSANQPAIKIATSSPDSTAVPWLRRRELAPVPLFAACGSSGWMSYTPHDGRLVLHGTVAADSSAYMVGRPRQSTTDAERLAVIRHQIALELRGALDPRAEAAAAELAAKSGELFSPIRPDFVAAACTPTGAMWLQRFDPTRAPGFGGRSWYVVPRSGKPREVYLPESLRILWADDLRMLGVRVEESGVERLVLLELAKQ